MLNILFALGPIFLLILIGYGIKKKQWVSDDFWSPAELMTYYVFFPSLLLYTTSRTDMGDLQVMPMAYALVAATILVAAVMVKVRPWLKIDGADFTSFFQGGIRPNSYVGIAAAVALWGDPGLTLVAIAIAFIVPLVNFLSVVVMETYGAKEFRRSGGPRLVSLGKSILSNPLILACVLGVLINASGAGLPPVLEPLIQILGRAALPIGLLCVGAGLDFEAMRDTGKTVVLSSLLKLLCLPLVCLLCCQALGVEGITRDLCILYSGLPVSASSYVLARKMGGNAPVMAGIITLTTLGAMVSLPLLLQIIDLL
ncbi:Auxin Efflux Carrier [Candidatus Terasakiella magnetica]|uniref:Auxin Efflux Carrier n=1 Tax=Candidatus Terasakiella magnetica TaxID=1867952 RepID=A0A1C3RJV5_9PROT|nr:AEC family transporter [Candidatus Terasakiella magnetica]SCA57572.1 Auxin Efflux Carrier [Candidatus Terasakiella magnetica]